MVDKIVVTVHVTINGVPLEIWIAQTYLKLSPISLISVTYSQDATHVKYARFHNEEWISNGRMLHSISSECISHEIILLFKYTEEALPHRNLSPFHGWSRHRFELVVLPLMGQAIDR